MSVGSPAVHQRDQSEGTTISGLRMFIFLPFASRFADVGLLLLRCVAGAFLIYQSQDNVFSAERMNVFAVFLAEHGFRHPDLMAPLSVYCQFAAGIAFVLGILTRWFGLITAVNFIVAVRMVHWADPVPGIWPAAILVFLGLYLALRGSGRYGLDTLFERVDSSGETAQELRRGIGPI